MLGANAGRALQSAVELEMVPTSPATDLAADARGDGGGGSGASAPSSPTKPSSASHVSSKRLERSHARTRSLSGFLRQRLDVNEDDEDAAEERTAEPLDVAAFGDPRGGREEPETELHGAGPSDAADATAVPTQMSEAMQLYLGSVKSQSAARAIKEDEARRGVQDPHEADASVERNDEDAISIASLLDECVRLAPTKAEELEAMRRRFLHEEGGRSEKLTGGANILRYEHVHELRRCMGKRLLGEALANVG